MWNDELKSLFESSDTSVSVNGVYLRARDLPNALGHYSFNLLVWNHDETFKVSLLGSATPLFYRHKFFVLCTGHQIKDVKSEEISIITETGEFAVTSSGYTAPRVDQLGMQHDLQDIVVFDFNTACEEHPSLQKKFFNLREFPPDCKSDTIVAVLNYGYPSDEQVYDLHDKNHIGSYRRETILMVDQPHSDETLLHLKPLSQLTFNPDGLSGGPNFVIQRRGQDFKAHFAGITVRGGKDDVYIVKSGYIKGLLDAAIDLRN